VKALNPEFGVGDIAKELGRRWSDVDPELKSKYEAMAEKDKARYDRVSWDWFNFISCWEGGKFGNLHFFLQSLTEI
jgi:hypothetical protein